MRLAQKILICGYCRYLAIRDTIIQDEATRQDERYAQVIPLLDLEQQFSACYPSLYETVLESFTGLDQLLTGMNSKQNYLGTWGFMLANVSTLKLLDYKGLFLDDTLSYQTFFVALPPTTKQRQIPALVEPIQPATKTSTNQMNAELEEIYKSLCPAKQAMVAHAMLISKINNILGRVWYGYGYKVHAYGSSVTELLLDGSDLDLSIVLPDDQVKMDTYLMELRKLRGRRMPAPIFDMNFLSRQLALHGMANIKVIKAQVPICKFTDPSTNLNCDLSIHNTLAIENSQLIKAYISLDHRIRPFLYLVKHFTKCRHINDNVSGTLSSYGFILLALYYLMNTPKPVIPNLQKLPADYQCYSPKCAAKLYGQNQGSRLFLLRGNISRINVFYHDCINVVYDQEHTPPSTLIMPTADTTCWKSENNSDLATLLIGFFSFYTSPGFENITVRFDRSPMPYASIVNNLRLVIYDPFLTSKNVAAACTQTGFALIKSEFKRASSMLLNGNKFKDVCCPPDLISRQYDPYSIKNRKKRNDMFL